MVPENPVYRKRNSFIDIRYSQSVQDIIPRIEKLQDSLDSLTLTPYQRNIIKKAITDILDPDQAVQNSLPYSLTPYSFTPKTGLKLVSNLYMDMGQGFLECLQDIRQDLDHSEKKDSQ